MAKYRSEGKVIKYTPVSAVNAGDVVVVGALVGVATEDIAAGAKGSLAIEGVFEFDKTAGSGGEAFTAGQLVYWNATSEEPDSNNLASNQLGYVVEAADADASTVKVKLVPGPADASSGS